MARATQERKGGRPSRERAARIDQAIVDATIDAFAEHGIDFVMDRMAAAAGISKQAVYRRWPGKTDLLVHALDREVVRMAAAMVTGLPSDPHEAARELAWRMFDTNKSRAIRLATFLKIEALHDPILRGRLLRWRATLLALLEERIAALPQVAAHDPGAAATLEAIAQDMLAGASAALGWAEAPAGAYHAVFASRWNAFLRIVAHSADDALPVKSDADKTQPKGCETDTSS